jgi:spore cortex formation protein SpoVR/YcgB (stage V sporulation)
MLQHKVHAGRLVNEKDTARVLHHLADLWGYEVTMSEVEGQADTTLKQHSAKPSS